MGLRGGIEDDTRTGHPDVTRVEGRHSSAALGARADRQMAKRVLWKARAAKTQHRPRNRP